MATRTPLMAMTAVQALCRRGEHDAGPIEDVRIEKEDPLPVRSSRRLRDFCLVLHLLGHVCCLMNFVRISVSTSCRRRRVEGG